MDKEPFGDAELEFPLDCHYRIITEDREGVQASIEKTLRDMKIETPLKEGNRSEGGKYVTYSITIHVESLEIMRAIDVAIRSIDGVRMVL